MSLPEDITIKKEALKENIENLIKLIEEKCDSKQSIKVYDYLTSVIKEEFEKLNLPIQKCRSCGESLESWEKEICGPCKIADERYQEEED